ncbi:hypothetical protein L195_g051286 [Trifolium pratense]|uniref:Uncharacterized protein n=1 Tax=Trifolium pratense TaxID=57577 RepID=A0A2K3JYP3_TRIPR|nr:hypothetical protein L195_g051286 [Trifolium pratense]
MQLVRLSQNPRIVGGKRFLRGMNLITQGAEDVTVKLVGLTPLVVGGKIFKKTKDISRVEDVKVNLVGLRRVVGCKRNNQTK